MGDAADYREKDDDGHYVDVYLSPDLTVRDIEGDWKSLPSLLLYKIAELPVLLRDAGICIENLTSHLNHPPENRPSIEVRQGHYAALGIRACELSFELRRLSGFPESELAHGEWSAMPVLRRVILRENDKKRRVDLDTEI